MILPFNIKCYIIQLLSILFVFLDLHNKIKKIYEMSDFVEEKAKSILQNRKQFENNVNSCQQWFSEVEVIMSADVRQSSLQIIEDQLKKVN